MCQDVLASSSSAQAVELSSTYAMYGSWLEFQQMVAVLTKDEVALYRVTNKWGEKRVRRLAVTAEEMTVLIGAYTTFLASCEAATEHVSVDDQLDDLDDHPF